MELVFFQKHWSIVGGKVRHAVLQFLNNGAFDPSLNFTCISLIPKHSNASLGNDFRPISLCNVFFF
jgi:hypothetical protein